MEAASACIEELQKELRKADVLVMTDGNVDFLAYVYKKFAPQLGATIVTGSKWLRVVWWACDSRYQLPQKDQYRKPVRIMWKKHFKSPSNHHENH